MIKLIILFSSIFIMAALAGLLITILEKVEKEYRLYKEEEDEEYDK